jgi:tRNA A-37 threonylcarbamoyl transferase component Bud32
VGASPIPLKQSPRRTVALWPPETPGARPLVVKRYHHPDRIARFFDRSRAEQELGLLRRLFEAGVPVPRPVEVRRAAGAWELVTEWIEGAVSLEDVLNGRAPAPAPIEVLARSTGELLARAHAAGLDHPDLHPGNLLVQPGAKVWMVDVRGARVLTRLDPEIRRRDLVALASATRERLDERARARFLSSYRRALPARLASDLPPRAQLAREIESAARIHRREAVRRARLRWTRLSSVCRPVEVAGLTGYRSAEIEAAGSRVVVVRDLPWREILECWYAAARLCDHAIPSARPLLLVREPRRCAVFALPESARALREMPGSGAGASVQRSLEALLASLRDRGLALEGPFLESIFVDATGRCCLGPLTGVRLRDVDG